MVREKRGQRRHVGSIWETPGLKKILEEPVGAPMELTRDEALAILDEHLSAPPSYDAKAAEREHRQLREIRRDFRPLLDRPGNG